MEESKVLTPANNKKKIAIFIFLFVAIVGIIIGYFYVQYKKTHITTDDAFIEGRVHIVSPKVSGTIKNIHVIDNQLVKKDALLIEIDTEDFDVNVKEASSVLDAAKKQYEEFKSEVGAAKADLELQKATLKQAETDMKRAENLFKEDIIPKERVEKTTTGYDIAVAQVASAREELKRADHLIYVTLKYTRTSEVIKNTIKRLISAFDFSILEVLEHLKMKKKIKTVPTITKLRAELLQDVLPETKYYIEFYFLLKQGEL